MQYTCGFQSLILLDIPLFAINSLLSSCEVIHFARCSQCIMSLFDVKAIFIEVLDASDNIRCVLLNLFFIYRMLLAINDIGDRRYWWKPLAIDFISNRRTVRTVRTITSTIYGGVWVGGHYY